MNKIAKSAVAATFTVALIAGFGTGASAHGKKPVCPTATTTTTTTVGCCASKLYTEVIHQSFARQIG